MGTEMKIESNRNNAKKSTGPKTAAGKAVVSQNARTHGLLSRNLIVEGESQEEFSELLSLLVDEFQPGGLVEHALVERVGISLWRQRRLVRAESAEVSINQQRFNSWHKGQVATVLDLKSEVYDNIQAPEDESEETDIAFLKDSRDLWRSLLNDEIADEDDPFAHLPAKAKKTLLELHEVEASQIDKAVKKEFGTWDAMFENYAAYYESLIKQQRILELSRLIMQSRAMPSNPDLLSRYQTALDNDLYKALRALREAQAWRQSRALICAMPVNSNDDGNEK
jgi:hypothetical protein